MDVAIPQPHRLASSDRAGWISRLSLLGAGAVLIALLLGTHLPVQMVPSVAFRIAPDKVLHALGYGTLAFFLYGGIRLRYQCWYTTALIVVAGVAVLSTLDELTQPLTGRHRELLDFLASTGGAMLGATMAVLAEKVLRRLLQRGSRSGERTVLTLFTSGNRDL